MQSEGSFHDSRPRAFVGWSESGHKNLKMTNISQNETPMISGFSLKSINETESFVTEGILCFYGFDHLRI